MSILHIRHIEKTLSDIFSSMIDLSDFASRSVDDQRSLFLTRALAAFIVQSRTGCDAAEAASSIIDGYQDNGIDAIFVDQTTGVIFLVQSKWSKNGHGTISLGDTHKFIAGVRDLLHGRHDQFNDKAQPILERLPSILDRVGCRIELLIVHTSTQSIAPHARQVIDEFVASLNDTSEVVYFEDVNQRSVYDAVSRSFDGAPVSIDVTLLDWGRLEEPYKAYYGQVSADKVGEWWNRYRERIFAKNIRQFLPNSLINKMITETFVTDPVDFWYMNNGITVLCEKLEKKIWGGSDRNVGYFYCQGVSIINGAQTVGAIGRAYSNYSEQAKRARVFARFISLEDCPPDFARRVTIATNTQNRIQSRDFAALDPEQERIRRELQFENIEYVYKTGVPLPSPDSGCTIEDATVALACAAEDLKLAVAAKANLGSLWELEKSSYKTIFNPTVNGPAVWEAVKVLYVVEHKLRDMRKFGSYRMCAYHGNRFALRQVFRVLRRSGARNLPDIDVAGLAQGIVERVSAIVSALDLYPAWAFKSAEKCSRVEEALKFEEFIPTCCPGIFEEQFREAAKGHPNYRPQMSLFPDDDVLV